MQLRERLVAEIVGPAGAGKSTLLCALNRRDRRIRTGLGVWGLPRSLLVFNALLTLPFILRLCRARRRRLSWREVELWVRMRALSQLLRRELSKGDASALVLDEGAVFALARLRAFDPEGFDTTGGFDPGTRALLEEWARRLNTIIWLDAPDATLAARIRTRRKPHRVKRAGDAELSEFLARYRATYERILSELAVRYGLKVIRFSTDEETLEKIAEKVLAANEPRETISA